MTDKNIFPKAYIKKLVNEACANSLAKVKDPKQIISGQTIVKSVSDKKRPDKVKRVIKTKKNNIEITIDEYLLPTWVLLQVWQDVVIFGFSTLSAAVSADGMLLDF